MTTTITLPQEVDILIADGRRIHEAKIPVDLLGDEFSIWSWLKDWSEEHITVPADEAEDVGEIQLQAINLLTRDVIFSGKFFVPFREY